MLQEAMTAQYCLHVCVASFRPMLCVCHDEVHVRSLVIPVKESYQKRPIIPVKESYQKRPVMRSLVMLPPCLTVSNACAMMMRGVGRQDLSQPLLTLH